MRGRMRRRNGHKETETWWKEKDSGRGGWGGGGGGGRDTRRQRVTEGGQWEVGEQWEAEVIFHLSFIWLIKKSTCIFVFRFAGKEHEIWLHVALCQPSVRWASVPLVWLTIVSTFHTVLCPGRIGSAQDSSQNGPIVGWSWQNSGVNIYSYTVTSPNQPSWHCPQVRAWNDLPCSKV